MLELNNSITLVVGLLNKNQTSLKRVGQKSKFFFGTLSRFLDSRLRRTCLESLCVESIKPDIVKRAMEAQLKNYVGLHTNLIESFRRTGVVIVKKPKNNPTQNLPNTKKIGRCFIWTKTDNKSSETCSHCEGFVCKNHSEQIKLIFIKTVLIRMAKLVQN
ncbi:hypothetical protein BpHYR1_014116 [Brachionus plicatilis]|uniref:Uncharacterized protein n=1 Tax=Brachionus plicatilis TaxID=10195 RepID=A0A3M7RQX7_BRAPC|nr:hypothetical protein BpHYR1_014116 [Brachionus plicatilis]